MYVMEWVNIKMALLKLLISMICVIGFTYQTISLTMEYLSGNTVVNIMVGPLFKEELPAITICPGSIHIGKVAKLSETLRHLYQHYLNYTDLYKSPNLTKDYTFLVLNAYNKAKNIIESLMTSEEMNIGNMFFNYTYNYNYERPSIKFYLHETSIIEGDIQQLINQSNIVKMDNGKENYLVKVDPIESMVLDYSSLKCYTFFSHIDSVWKKVKIDFKRIRILAQFDLMSYPHIILPLPIFIHSPNDLPLYEHGKMLPLTPGYSQTIQYSTIKILRLGRDYETDCREYGKGYEFDTRSSCIVSCIKHHHDTICDNSSLPELGNLVTEKYIKINYNKKITNCTDYPKIKQDALVNCSKQCNFNCNYKYYPANIQRINYIEDFSSSDVIMEHNTMPDILIKYIPESSLISFACNFGGLLGMWLGLSFLSIIENFIDSIFKLKFDRITINSFSNRINLFNSFRDCNIALQNQMFFQSNNVFTNSR